MQSVAAHPGPGSSGFSSSLFSRPATESSAGRGPMCALATRRPGCSSWSKGAASGLRLNHSVSRLDCRRPSPGVSLLIRYHVEQRRGRALSGSGRPLARTSAGLARGSGGLLTTVSGLFTLSTAPRLRRALSKPRAWSADTRFSLSASLRLPARRLLRARREAHPIGDRIEAPVHARQRRRRCPPESST